MKKSPLKLKPTENQTFILAGSGDGGDLVRRLELSHEEERRGDFRSACSERYEAFRLIVDVLPEDEAASQLDLLSDSGLEQRWERLQKLEM